MKNICLFSAKQICFSIVLLWISATSFSQASGSLDYLLRDRNYKYISKDNLTSYQKDYLIQLYIKWESLEPKTLQYVKGEVETFIDSECEMDELGIEGIILPQSSSEKLILMVESVNLYMEAIFLVELENWNIVGYEFY